MQKSFVALSACANTEHASYQGVEALTATTIGVGSFARTPGKVKPLRVAIAGLGAIGKVVAERIVHSIPDCRLVAASARDVARARSFLDGLGCDAPILPLRDLPEVADLVVEAMPASAFDELADATLARGRILMVISVGALVSRPHLFEAARQYGARIVAPTGALIGLDAVQAAAEGTIESVRMITRKPPNGLKGAPYLAERDISLDGLSEPLKVFEGNARDAVRGFPANVNVVAALSLAGIGPEKTMIEIWADPAADRNRHRIVVESDSASFSMEIQNIPTQENPKTGRITALSVVAAIRKYGNPVQVGT